MCVNVTTARLCYIDCVFVWRGKSRIEPVYLLFNQSPSSSVLVFAYQCAILGHLCISSSINYEHYNILKSLILMN